MPESCPYVVGNTTKHCTLAARDTVLVQQARERIRRHNEEYANDGSATMYALLDDLLVLFGEEKEKAE